VTGWLERTLGALPTGLLDRLFERAQRLPLLKELVERELSRMLEPVAHSLRPYRGDVPTFTALPERGLGHEATLAWVRSLAAREEPRWHEGYASGAVYEGDAAHVEFLNQVMAATSQTNPLHLDLFPSASKYEAEIVAMTATMLGGATGDRAPSGTVTSGGTESIVLAMKAYRDHARRERRAREVEVVAPVSAHPAFDKAAELLGLTLVRVPVAADLRADVSAMRDAVTPRTVALVGSAPSFPHGVIDPIAELSELARARDIGLHVDACLGGFVLPWAKKLGYPVPAFDFSLPGVSSISADTHKYGYAAKGTSVVVYRDRALCRAQYFVSTDWPGGLYGSPTLAGSRPGSLVAACWATLVSTGEAGYLEATRAILETASQIRRGIAEIPGLYVLGDPLWVIAFAADDFDVYAVLDRLTKRGWSLNGLQRPPSVHLCVTLRHTQPGVAERFLADLRAAVAESRSLPPVEGGMAPLYGLASSFPARGAVAELVRRYIERWYEP
jgi:glutamate/tyrosine decarboxylase-like PLP-dependent enzyme